MKSEEKREVANTLSEKGIWIRIGFLPFRLRPITLAQIYEMGAIANDINADGLEEKKKIKRSECPYGGIDCAWCGEDCE